MSKNSKKQPLVGVIMGSESDWETMKDAVETLKSFQIEHEVEVVSAHRTPLKMAEYAIGAQKRGLKIIIAGAGGAAHLPGMVASLTVLPVIGVPIESKALKGLDSLLSIAQMPKGIPVATMAIGNSQNAALLAVRILALESKKLTSLLIAEEIELQKKVKVMNKNIKGKK
jgi:5-(carboxyamino)imidazole ribonucleotide mutase